MSHRPPTLTADEIIHRMQQGERLRWVDGRVIGLSTNRRFLRIGNVTLDNEGETEVIRLEIAGRIRMTTDDPHNRKQFLDFELCDC